jgi:chromosome segregation ATPase
VLRDTLQDTLQLAAVESEREKLQQEIQELNAQRETVKHIIEGDTKALRGQLEEMVSSLRGAWDRLSDAKELGREVEEHLSSLAERLEEMELGHRRAEEALEASGKWEDASGEEESEEARIELRPGESWIPGVEAQADVVPQMSQARNKGEAPKSGADLEAGWKEKGEGEAVAGNAVSSSPGQEADPERSPAWWSRLNK